MDITGVDEKNMRLKTQNKFCREKQMASSHDYVATKKVLMRFLQETITPVIYTRMTDFYNDSIKYAKQNNLVTQNVFVTFLNEVPNWNDACVTYEETSFNAKFPQMYGVYKALWVSTLKVISSVRLGTPKDIQTTVRPLKDFIHEIYKETAKDLASDPTLFDRQVPPAQLRKNRKEIMDLISNAIPDALGRLLPVAEIYRALGEDVEGKRVFEGIEPSPEPAPEPSPEPSPSPKHDELEDIRREAKKIKQNQPENISPRPSYGSPPRAPGPVEPPKKEERTDPKEYDNFTSDPYDDDDDDPYLKDLPTDYDAQYRPEPEDDFHDSDEDF